MKRITKGAALVAGTCLALALLPRLAKSADHLDSPAVSAEGVDKAADINDLYSWMDGNNAIFALTVLPAASPTSLFSDKVQYVIHTSSAAKFGDPETNKDIICTFAGTAAPQTASCWLGATDEFVTGDASGANGLTSADGKFKVFAGVRKDPFFFNLDGFKATVKKVEAAAGSLSFDAGCPLIDNGTAQDLRDTLQQDGGGGTGVDFFQNLNALAIVVSVDKTLVTGGGPIVASWASTHKAQ